MIINHNLASLNTLNSLNKNEKATQSSLAKLSSGLRINTAADDAAGLAISEKMRGQIRGLDQAKSNANDDISLVQTAEGALNETTSILQRMRELAVQSANDSETDSDRKNIQDEMNQLNTEIDRISTTTQFNTKNLLDGSMGAAVSTAVANIQTSNAAIESGGAAATTGSTLVSLQDSNGNSLGITATDTLTVSYVKNGTTYSNTLTAAALTVADIGTTGFGADAALTVVGGKLTVTAATAGYAGAINGITITVKDSAGTTRTAATNALSNISETTAAADVEQDGHVTFQIGANTNQNMTLTISNMGAAALGVKGIQVTTQAQANVAIKVIDAATQKVSAERSKLGAVQNRLEHTINNLSTSSENLTSAESRIRDVDMASEMANYQKTSVLQQAAQAMLAQANQQPQQVLKLLQ